VEIYLLVLMLLHAVACECWISFCFYMFFVLSFVVFVPKYVEFSFWYIFSTCRSKFLFK